MKRCPNCKNEYESGKFCPECGATIEDVVPEQNKYIHCPKCGTKNDLDAKFCEECGTKLVSQGENINQVDDEDSKKMRMPLKEYKRIKRAEAFNAYSHRNDSDEAKERNRQLWAEYTSIISAIENGAFYVEDMLDESTKQKNKLVRDENDRVLGWLRVNLVPFLPELSLNAKLRAYDGFDKAVNKGLKIRVSKENFQKIAEWEQSLAPYHASEQEIQVKLLEICAIK